MIGLYGRNYIIFVIVASSPTSVFLLNCFFLGLLILQILMGSSAIIIHLIYYTGLDLILPPKPSQLERRWVLKAAPMIFWQLGPRLKFVRIVATWSKKVHRSLFFVRTFKLSRPHRSPALTHILQTPQKKKLDAEHRVLMQEQTSIALSFNRITRENSNQRKG